MCVTSEKACFCKELCDARLKWNRKFIPENLETNTSFITEKKENRIFITENMVQNNWENMSFITEKQGGNMRFITLKIWKIGVLLLTNTTNRGIYSTKKVIKLVIIFYGSHTPSYHAAGYG